MAFESLARAITRRLGDQAVAVDAPLAPLTTFKVGGPADVLVRIGTLEDLTDVLALAGDAGAPVAVIGGGSNLLVADTGVRGVVLRLAFTNLEARSADRIRAGAGVTMNGLVRWTVGRGAAGLEAWAGTPGTVGGAIYGNAHYGGRNIGDRVAAVGLVDAAGTCTTVDHDRMGFAYDTSRVQQTREIVAWADFRVSPGEPAALRASARASLAHRKRTQPLASQSAGCVFQNPDPRRDRLPATVPASAGALVDRAGLKGHRVGGAMVSALHANFIVNTGGATAADIAGLMALARRAVREQFDVELRDEIVRLGDIPC
jgi:UDP-N-acetylmuramate dehydrogenase